MDDWKSIALLAAVLAGMNAWDEPVNATFPRGEGVNPLVLDGDCLSCWEQLNATDRTPPLGN